jgi:hypothetical protein
MTVFCQSYVRTTLSVFGCIKIIARALALIHVGYRAGG